MSTRKLKSTRLNETYDFCNRVYKTPMIHPSQVRPSHSALEVIGVLNPTFIQINGADYLIIRVDERPSICNDKMNTTAEVEYELPIAIVNIDNNEQIEIINVKVPKDYNPKVEPILPNKTIHHTYNTSGKKVLLAYISHFRLVRLYTDKIVVNDKPIIFPNCKYNQYGCEDPRVVEIKGHIYITYTSVGQYGATAWIAELDNDGLIKNPDMVFGPDHKHTVLFPKTISGYYFSLSRPLSRTYINSSGIWLYDSKDLQHWRVKGPILMPRIGFWDSVRVGASASPMITDAGWLQFYYGVDDDDSYHLGAVFLDIWNPEKVIRRTNVPILSPILEWEKNGRRADTVFSCGYQYYEDSRNIRIYYGAADTFIGAADINLDDLLRII